MDNETNPFDQIPQTYKTELFQELLTHAIKQEDESLLQFFAYSHLPAHLAAVSKPFCDLARAIIYGGSLDTPSSWGPMKSLPSNTERTMALRKLLEAKDAAVRAAISKGS